MNSVKMVPLELCFLCLLGCAGGTPPVPVEAIPGRYRHVDRSTGNYEELVISGTTYVQLGYMKSGELWLRNEGTCRIYETLEEYRADRREGESDLEGVPLVVPLILLEDVVRDSYDYMRGEYGPLSRELGDSLKGGGKWTGMVVSRDTIIFGSLAHMSGDYHRVEDPTPTEKPQPTPSPSSGPP